VLKITVIDSPTEQRLLLEGRLADSDLAVLQAAWENTRGLRGTRMFVVDLTNTISFDQSAEGLLRSLREDGARFVACGVKTRHRLEELGIECK
jgi:hypothetical protein